MYCTMDVDKISITNSESWNIPLAAVFCLAIAVYVILIIIGLSVRQCLLRKGVCGGQCPDVPCCNCAELGLHCAQACCNCGPKPSCTSIIDGCCPANQECSCLRVGSCWMCQDCASCDWCEGTSCMDFCATSMCNSSPLCECQSCSCTCTPPECTTINCLCCEITIKGRGPQGET